MVGQNCRRTRSVCVHAYAPTLHVYASVFISSYKRMRHKLQFFSSLIFFFHFIFLIQRDSYAPVPVFYRFYLIS